jgi:hypothetical protein
MSKELHYIEISVCPKLLAEQKQTLLAVIELLQERKNTSGIFIDHLDGLLNMLDWIEDEIKFGNQD